MVSRYPIQRQHIDQHRYDEDGEDGYHERGGEDEDGQDGDDAGEDEYDEDEDAEGDEDDEDEEYRMEAKSDTEAAHWNESLLIILFILLHRGKKSNIKQKTHSGDAQKNETIVRFMGNSLSNIGRSRFQAFTPIPVSYRPKSLKKLLKKFF